MVLYELFMPKLLGWFDEFNGYPKNSSFAQKAVIHTEKKEFCKTPFLKFNSFF
jgi:hypothetical protein